MTLSSTKTHHNNKQKNRILNNSNILFVSLFSVIVFLTYTNIIFAETEQLTAPEESGFMKLINGSFVSATLSSIVIAVIAYLAGRLRSVTMKLQVIPSLQENQVEIKKNMIDIKDLAEKNNKDMREQLERNSNELKRQLDKLDEKVDKRFDVVSDMQRSIERDMNEKVMNLVYTLRNYNDSNNNNRNNNVKYKE